MTKRPSLKIAKTEHFSLMVTFILIFVLMGIVNGRKFLSLRNISAMAYQLPMIGLLALGMMVSELTGGINLSIVATANFNSIIIYIILNALTHGKPASSPIGFVVLALAAGFLMCGLIGWINGMMIAKLEIPALLVTLGMMTLMQGLSLLLTKGYTVSGYPQAVTFLGNGSVLKIPMSIIIFLIVIWVSHIILDKTVYGRRLYMTGANRIAAKYSNVNIDEVIVWEFIFSSMFSFFASVIMIGQMNSAKANYYESYVLIAVLASFLGGVNPAGGFGKLAGTVIASLILQVISTGLNLMRLDPFMVTAMWGAIIIIVLFGKEFVAKTRLSTRRKKIKREVSL